MDADTAIAVGELDIVNATEVLAQWQDLGDSRQLDLAKLEAVDSAGLSVLLHWDRAARAKGYELGYLNASAKLSQLAKMAGLSDLINIQTTS